MRLQVRRLQEKNIDGTFLLRMSATQQGAYTISLQLVDLFFLSFSIQPFLTRNSPLGPTARLSTFVSTMCRAATASARARMSTRFYSFCCCHFFPLLLNVLFFIFIYIIIFKVDLGPDRGAAGQEPEEHQGRRRSLADVSFILLWKCVCVCVFFFPFFFFFCYHIFIIIVEPTLGTAFRCRALPWPSPLTFWSARLRLVCPPRCSTRTSWPL